MCLDLSTSTWKQCWKSLWSKKRQKCALYDIDQSFCEAWAQAYHLKRSDLTEMHVASFSSQNAQTEALKAGGWSKCSHNKGKRYLRVNNRLWKHSKSCVKMQKKAISFQRISNNAIERIWEVTNVGSRTTLLWNYILERKGQKHWKSKGYKCSTIENTNEILKRKL